jgi:hypothetical protein
MSLVIADRGRCRPAAGRSESAAALSALLHFLDRPSVDLLSQVLEADLVGTVRLLDRLAEAGYVRRRPPTAEHVDRADGCGQAAVAVSEARATVLGGAGFLSPQERGRSSGSAEGIGRHDARTRRDPVDLRLCGIGVCAAPGGCGQQRRARSLRP